VQPAFELGPIDRDGRVVLTFNQPLLAPPFTKEPNVNGSGSVAFSELNVTRDVIDFRYRLRNKEISEDLINYDLIIEDWDMNSLKLRFVFEDPLKVTYGNIFDLGYMEIKNPFLFVSDSTGERLSDQVETMVKVFPKQVSKDVDWQVISSVIKQIFYVFLAITVLFLAFKRHLMGSISDIWVLLYACQMVLYINIYDVYMPANAQEFITSFRRLVEFDWLNPVKYYITFWDRNFRLSDYLSGTGPQPFDTEDQSFNILEELQFYAILTVITISIIIILGIIRTVIICSESKRQWASDKLV